MSYTEAIYFSVFIAETALYYANTSVTNKSQEGSSARMLLSKSVMQKPNNQCKVANKAVLFAI